MPFASTLCGACYDVCPVKIDIPSILVELRARQVDAERGGVPGGLEVGMRAMGTVMRSPRLFSAAERALGLGRFLARDGAIRRLPWPGSLWTDSRDLPAPPVESFRSWWQRERGEGS